MASNILSCPVPANVNPLSPNGFMFTVGALPEVQYFCQEVNLPGITLGEPAMFNPFNAVPVPGEHLTYDSLSVKFLIDENMENYTSIYNWIVALGYPESYQQYVSYISTNQQTILGELAKNYSQGTLQILGSNNQPIRTVTFVDMFPTNIGSITFQSTNQDVQYLVGDATFRFSYYKFE